MEEKLVYPENYIFDEESEVLAYGFYIVIEGKDLFKGQKYRFRCFRCIERLFVSRGIEVYAINCKDDSLHMMVGNCTYCDLQTALRFFISSFLIFLKKPADFMQGYKTSIHLIKSVKEFKQIFYKVTTLDQYDFAQCISDPWSSFSHYLTNKWALGYMISKDKVYEAFGGKRDPFDFTREVFSPHYIDGKYVKKIYAFQDLDEKHDKIIYAVNVSFAEFYALPIDFFYLFPRMADIMTVRALKNKKLTSLIVYNMIKNGISFRKCAEYLGCSYSKVYNMYYKYLAEADNGEKEDA